MTAIIQGYQLREIALGIQVLKAAQTPPNSGSSATLFTVSGGSVLVTSLLGEVSTVLSGTTGQISLGTVPTVGTTEAAGIATATVVGGAEAGTWMGVQSSSGLAGALAINAEPAKAGFVVWLSAPFVVPAGTISVSTTVATMTGAITWYLHYVPLDTGAAVA